MKYIIFIGDGIGDYPNPEKKNATPLQYAHTPHIDKLALQSQFGFLKTIPPSLPKGSAVANLTILGYDPKTCFAGRGVLEAASLGLSMSYNDVVMRCNLIATEKGTIKDYHADHISSEEAHQLIDILQAKLGSDTIKFYPGISYRHIIIFSGDKYSDTVTTQPPHDFIGKKVQSLLPSPAGQDGEFTTSEIRRLIEESKELLTHHPVNKKRKENGKNTADLIWPWGIGKKPAMTPFKEKFGISGAVVAAVDLIFGIGVLAGMNKIEVEGATGYYDTNYEGKAHACVEALKTYDFVFCHVEAPDEAGHAGDWDEKVRAIENFDKRLIGTFLTHNTENVRIAILYDHFTPLTVGTHTSEPVPFMIYESTNKTRENAAYTEKLPVDDFGVLEGDAFIKLFLEK